MVRSLIWLVLWLCLQGRIGRAAKPANQLGFTHQQDNFSLLAQLSIWPAHALWLQWNGQPAPWQLQIHRLAWVVEDTRLGQGCMGACPPMPCCQPLVEGGRAPRWSRRLLEVNRQRKISGPTALDWWGVNWHVPLARFGPTERPWRLQAGLGLAWSLPPYWWWQRQLPAHWRWQSQWLLVQGKGRRALGGWAVVERQPLRRKRMEAKHVTWQVGLHGRWQWDATWHWHGRLLYLKRNDRWRTYQQLRWRFAPRHGVRTALLWQDPTWWRLAVGLDVGLLAPWRSHLGWRVESGQVHESLLANQVVRGDRWIVSGTHRAVQLPVSFVSLDLSWRNKRWLVLGLACEQGLQQQWQSQGRKVRAYARFRLYWLDVHVQADWRTRSAVRGRFIFAIHRAGFAFGCDALWRGAITQQGVLGQSVVWQWYGVWRW